MAGVKMVTLKWQEIGKKILRIIYLVFGLWFLLIVSQNLILFQRKCLWHCYVGILSPCLNTYLWRICRSSFYSIFNYYFIGHTALFSMISNWFANEISIKISIKFNLFILTLKSKQIVNHLNFTIRFILDPIEWICIQLPRLQINIEMFRNGHEAPAFSTKLFPCPLIIVFLIHHHGLVV